MTDLERLVADMRAQVMAEFAKAIRDGEDEDLEELADLIRAEQEQRLVQSIRNRQEGSNDGND